MVNLAAESFECRSGNATHHKASLNSDLMQQRTFSRLHLRRKNNKDPVVPNGKSPDGWKQSNPLGDGSCVTATVGRILHFSRIGLLRVEGASHTWAAIKMQMKLWPSTSVIVKAKMCLILTNRKVWHLKSDYWPSEVPVQPIKWRNMFLKNAKLSKDYFFGSQAFKRSCSNNSTLKVRRKGSMVESTMTHIWSGQTTVYFAFSY